MVDVDKTVSGLLKKIDTVARAEKALKTAKKNLVAACVDAGMGDAKAKDVRGFTVMLSPAVAKEVVIVHFHDAWMSETRQRIQRIEERIARAARRLRRLGGELG